MVLPVAAGGGAGSQPDLRRPRPRGGRRLTAELTSAGVPPIGPDDHVSGSGTVEAIIYLDLSCPRCAAVWPSLRALEARLCLRHFPMPAKRPRATALHMAAEAAAGQGRFWEMADSLLLERGRVDDPHLWERVRRFGMDLERFETDRRSDEVARRVRRDFSSGVRAGVTGTPTYFLDGGAVADLAVELG